MSVPHYIKKHDQDVRSTLKCNRYVYTYFLRVLQSWLAAEGCIAGGHNEQFSETDGSCRMKFVSPTRWMSLKMEWKILSRLSVYKGIQAHSSIATKNLAALKKSFLLYRN